ncbi:MAG TPA: response regulator [Steroidobacteraceae bacterium]|nr:response regulator [Steroidobacteraceae bacterium]
MPRILLIDDDDDFRTMMSITLQRLGYEVEEANDGNKGIALHQQREFDVVMVDLIMPEKEGMETITEMRVNRPETKIIAMSGGGRISAKDILPMARAVGANQVLAKPFSNEEMLAAFKRLGV